MTFDDLMKNLFEIKGTLEELKLTKKQIRKINIIKDINANGQTKIFDIEFKVAQDSEKNYYLLIREKK